MGVLLQPFGKLLSQPAGFMMDDVAAEGPEVKPSSKWSWVCGGGGREVINQL